MISTDPRQAEYQRQLAEYYFQRRAAQAAAQQAAAQARQVQQQQGPTPSPGAPIYLGFGSRGIRFRR